jgi:hypothetical protein
MGMLLCLDRPHRLAYILGEILGLGHREAAEVLEITPAAFRKRLSRARQRLHAFLRSQCGLVSESAPCRCERRIVPAMARGRVDASRALFAGRDETTESLAIRQWRSVEAIREEADVLRSTPAFAASGRATEGLRALLESLGDPPARHSSSGSTNSMKSR